MRVILTTAIMISLFTFSCADREISDNITEPVISGLFTEIHGSLSGELTLDKSPYRVTNDLIVNANSILKINPGVEVYFDQNTRLIVYGELLVSGNYFKSVLLAAYEKTKYWRGIKIYNSSKPAKFDYSDIKDIKETGDSAHLSSAISIINSKADFMHCFIYENSAVYGGAIGMFNGEVVIKNNIIRDNKSDTYGGAVISEQSNLTLINNSLYSNISFNSGGGVYVLSPVETQLQNNIFYKNSSRTGNPNFEYASNDSSKLIEQYNYFALGDMDPLFYTDFDLRLYYLSPCKDAGNPDPVFNDYNGTRNDQGSYGGPNGDW